MSNMEAREVLQEPAPSKVPPDGASNDNKSAKPQDNNKKDLNTTRNVVILTITVAVVLALLIFSTYKVFSNYPFTLPSYIAFYIVILTLFVFFFPLTRTFLEFRMLKLLSDKSLEEFNKYVDQFLSDSSSSEDSIIAVKGEVRLIIALAIILILGIALFDLMVNPAFADFTKLIVGVFTGAITSIIGFYFGTKASKEGAEKTKKTQDGKGKTTATPKNGGSPPGETVTHLSLSASNQDEDIAFSGTLQKQNGEKLPKEVVEIEESKDNKNWEPIDATHTNMNGAYTIRKLFPPGTYYFRAHYRGTTELQEALSPSAKVISSIS